MALPGALLDKGYSIGSPANPALTLLRCMSAESSTSVLAREMDIDLVLMDDLLARRRAVRMGLTPMGTPGIMKLAVHREILTPKTAGNLVNELLAIHGMYLTPKGLHDFPTSIGLQG